MFLITLTFSNNKSNAKTYMPAHNAWIQKGMTDGLFLLVGSLVPQQGGAIIAQGSSLEEIEAFVSLDPFVQEGVVEASILHIAPNKADPRLSFLLPDAE